MKIDSLGGWFARSIMKDMEQEQQVQQEQQNEATNYKPDAAPAAPAFGHYVTPDELNGMNARRDPSTYYADEANGSGANTTPQQIAPQQGPFNNMPIFDTTLPPNNPIAAAVRPGLEGINALAGAAGGAINNMFGQAVEGALPTLEQAQETAQPFFSGVSELAGKIPFLSETVQAIGGALQGYQEHIGDPFAGIVSGQSDVETPKGYVPSILGGQLPMVAQALGRGDVSIQDILTDSPKYQELIHPKPMEQPPLSSAYSTLAKDQFAQGNIAAAADLAYKAFDHWGNTVFDTYSPVDQLAYGLLYDPMNFVGAEVLLGGIGESQKFITAANATADVTKIGEEMKEAPIIARTYDAVVKGLTGSGIIPSAEKAEDLIPLGKLGAAAPEEATRLRYANPLTFFKDSPLSKDLEYLNRAQDYVLNMAADDNITRADMKQLYQIANQAAKDQSLGQALDAMGKHKITNSPDFHRFVQGSLGFEPSSFADETYNQMASLRESLLQWSKTSNPSPENLKTALFDSRPFKEIVDGLTDNLEGKKKTYVEAYQGAFRRFQNNLDLFSTGKMKPIELQNATMQLHRDIENIGKLHLGSEYADNVQRVLQGYSKLPAANFAEKFINKIKPYESVLFIATNPHAISVNVIGNWVASAIHGVSPWESADNVRSLFGRVYGTDDTKQLVGRIGEVLVSITKDERYAHDMPLGAQLPKFLSHNPFSRLWQSTEYNANLRSFTTGFTRSYKQVWKYGNEIPAMSPELEKSIKAVIGDKQFKRLIQNIEDSYNTKELKAAVNSFFEQPRWQEYRDEIAASLSAKWTKRMGRPITITGELLDQWISHGSSERINKALRNAYRRAAAGEEMAVSLSDEAATMAKEVQAHRATVTKVMSEMRRQAETPPVTDKPGPTGTQISHQQINSLTNQQRYEFQRLIKDRKMTPKEAYDEVLRTMPSKPNPNAVTQKPKATTQNAASKSGSSSWINPDQLPSEGQVVNAPPDRHPLDTQGITEDFAGTPDEFKTASSKMPGDVTNYGLDAAIPKGVKIKVKDKMFTISDPKTIDADGGIKLVDGTRINQNIVDEVFDASGNPIWTRLSKKGATREEGLGKMGLGKKAKPDDESLFQDSDVADYERQLVEKFRTAPKIIHSSENAGEVERRLVIPNEIALQEAKDGIVYRGTTASVAAKQITSGMYPTNSMQEAERALNAAGINIENLSRDKRSRIKRFMESYSNQMGTISTAPWRPVASRWAGKGGEIARGVEEIALGKKVSRASNLEDTPVILKLKFKGEMNPRYKRKIQMIEDSLPDYQNTVSPTDKAYDTFQGNYEDFLAKPDELDILEVQDMEGNTIWRNEASSVDNYTLEQSDPLGDWDRLTPEQRINGFKDEVNFLEILKKDNPGSNSPTMQYYQDRVDAMLPMYNEMMGLPKDTPLPPRKKIVAQPYKPAQVGGAEVRFKTEKGSEYVVTPNGTTIRNKAARPEHPGDVGLKPESQKTYYLTKKQMYNIGGGFHSSDRFIIREIGGGEIGLEFVEGKYAGKVARWSVESPELQPKMGLYPLETWDDGRKAHFGNKIVEIGDSGTANVQPHAPAIKPKPVEQPVTKVAEAGPAVQPAAAVAEEVQPAVATAVDPTQVEMRKERLSIRQQKAAEWLRKGKNNKGEIIGNQVDGWTPEFIDRVMANQVPDYANAVVGFKAPAELGPIEDIFVRAKMPDELLLKMNRADAIRYAAENQLPMHTSVDEFIPDEADFRAFTEGKKLKSNPAIANVVDNWRPYGIRRISDTATAKSNILSGWKKMTDAEKVAYWNTLVNYVPRNKRTYGTPLTRGEFWEQARVAFRNLDDQQFQDTREIVDRWAWTIAQRRKWSLDETYAQIFAAVEPGKSSGNFMEQAADVGPNGFYSKLTRAAESLPDKFTVTELKSLLQKNGVKDAEMKWTGADDFIEQLRYESAIGRDSVSKQEFLDYVKKNQVQVKEIHRGTDISLTEFEEIDEGLWSLNDPELDFSATITKTDKGYFQLDMVANRQKFSGKYNTYLMAETSAQRKAKEMHVQRSSLKYGPNHYPGQWLPGGENHKELQLLWDKPSAKPGTNQFSYAQDVTGKIYIDNDANELRLIRPVTADDGYEAGDGYFVQLGDGHMVIGDDGQPKLFTNLDEAKLELEDDYVKQNPISDGNDYYGSHWDEPNVLAHIRFTDRVDNDGKKVLFIEEIQSDWAQKGRGKKGPDGKRENNFDTPERQAARRKHEQIVSEFDTEYRNLMELQDNDPEIKAMLEQLSYPFDDEVFTRTHREVAELSQKKFPEQWERVKAAEEKLTNSKNPPNGIPEGPFVTTTEDWYDLSTKRMIRYAAENGYDRIGWITGVDQVKRNSNELRRTIDKLEWTKYTHTIGNGGAPLGPENPIFDGMLKNGELVELPQPTYGLKGYKYGNQTLGKGNNFGHNVLDSELDDYVGGELAAKIRASARGSIEGEDIVVGGKGLLDAYDKIIPESFNRQGKKFGLRTGSTEIPIPNNQYGGSNPDMWRIQEVKKAYDGKREFYIVSDSGAPPHLGTFDNLDSAKRALREAQKLAKTGTPFQSMDITPELRESVLRDGFSLFQDPSATQKGSITWVNSHGEPMDGKAIIRAVSEAHDASTAIHEVAHAFVPWLDNNETAIFEKWVGLNPGEFKELHGKFVYKELSDSDIKKYRHAQEQFARGFELYMREGKAPVPELEGIFQRFSDFLKKIYEYITGSAVDVKLTPEMRKLYDDLLRVAPPAEMVKAAPTPQAVASTVKPTARPGRMLPPEVDDDWLKTIKPEDLVKPEVQTDAENMFVGDIMEEVMKLMGTEQALPGSPMPGQLRSKVNGWIDNQVNPRQREVKQMATAHGRWYQAHTVLNYNKRWNVDDTLSFAAPFTFWPMHMLANTTQEFIDRPALLNYYMRLRESYNDWSDSQTSGMPARFKGRIKINLPFLPDWMSDGVWVNPFKTVMPVDDIYHLDDLERAGYTSVPAAKGATEVPDVASFVSDFFGLHLPWKLAMDMYSGDKSNIEDTLANLPPTRILKALGLVGLDNGMNIAGINPTRSKWDAYYIERAARDMLAEGAFGEGEQAARNFKKALLERSGPLWAQAVERARLQNYAGSVIPGFFGMSGKVYTQGEQMYANARFERDAMLDNLVKANGGPTGMTQDQKYDYLKLMGANQELNKIYETHPELAGSSIRSKRTGDDDEKLYRNWLIDSIWTKIDEASDLEKRLWKAQLGSEYETYFYKKENRNIDSIQTPTLAGWANAMRVGAVNASESAGFAQPAPEPYKITFPTDQQNNVYQQYTDGVEKMIGWDNFYQMSDEYYALKDKDPEKAKKWLNESVEGKMLKAVWDTEDKMYKDNPGILKLLDAAGVTESKQRIAPAGSDQAKGQAWETAMYAVGYGSYDEYKAESDGYHALPKGSQARRDYAKQHPRLLRMFNISGGIYDTDQEVLNDQKGSGASNYFANQIIVPDSRFVRFPRPHRNPAGLPEGLNWATLGPLLRQFGTLPPGSQERQLLIDQNPELSYYFRMTPAPNMRLPYSSIIRGRINYQPKQFTQYKDPTTTDAVRKKIKYT